MTDLTEAEMTLAPAADAEAAAEPIPEPDLEPEPTLEPGLAAAAEAEAEIEAEATLEPVVEPGAPPVAMSVGRMFADAIRRGVRWAFTVPGESFLGLLEGLEAVGINVVATRHEGAAAFMAEAHAQLTGRPAACIGTRAVGGSNLAIGIHTAFSDSSPMFAFIGQVERRSRGREGFQEIDITETIGRLGKWSAEPTDVASAVQAAADAVDQAINGRPGPVVLSVAEDLLDELVPPELMPTLSRVPPPRPSDDEGARRPAAARGRRAAGDPGRRRRAPSAHVQRPAPSRRAASRAGGRLVAAR